MSMNSQPSCLILHAHHIFFHKSSNLNFVFRPSLLVSRFSIRVPGLSASGRSQGGVVHTSRPRNRQLSNAVDCARTRQSVAHGVRGTWNASADAADSVLPRSGAAQAALARAAQDCETASCSNATTWGAVDLSKCAQVRLCLASSIPARARAC